MIRREKKMFSKYMFVFVVLLLCFVSRARASQTKTLVAIGDSSDLAGAVAEEGALRGWNVVVADEQARGTRIVREMAERGIDTSSIVAVRGNANDEQRNSVAVALAYAMDKFERVDYVLYALDEWHRLNFERIDDGGAEKGSGTDEQNSEQRFRDERSVLETLGIERIGAQERFIESYVAGTVKSTLRVLREAVKVVRLDKREAPSGEARGAVIVLDALHGVPTGRRTVAGDSAVRAAEASARGAVLSLVATAAIDAQRSNVRLLSALASQYLGQPIERAKEANPVFEGLGDDVHVARAVADLFDGQRPSSSGAAVVVDHDASFELPPAAFRDPRASVPIARAPTVVERDARAYDFASSVFTRAADFDAHHSQGASDNVPPQDGVVDLQQEIH
jgi:NAD(P)-dependent dehydrogenase (short-subunit alcohol dehydrogenase family)